jgi:cysteine desulfurase
LDVIYLDHNASSPVPPELIEGLASLARSSEGNPSSLHARGRASRRHLNDAAEKIGRFLDCDSDFVFWTSGASEANSWALHSAVLYARHRGREKPRLIVSTIEHDSVLLAARALEASGAATVEWLGVNSHGQADLEQLRELLAEGPCDLVSLQYANNETGVIQPIEEATELAAAAEAPFHVDCVQAFGKIPLKLRELGPLTYATFSAHKLGALKGTGILAVLGEGRLLFPLVHGKQQKQLRGGTENPLGAAALARILTLIERGEAGFPERLATMQADFEAELKRAIPGARIHGEKSPRLPNTTYVGFEGIDGDGLLLNLDLEGICASSGAACTSGSVDPSHVLLAMGCDQAMARSSVRFSTGFSTTWAHYERALAVLPDIVERMRKRPGGRE